MPELRGKNQNRVGNNKFIGKQDLLVLKLIKLSILFVSWPTNTHTYSAVVVHSTEL